MYKVIRWKTDGTEEVWEAPNKPTFEQMYKLIGCTTIERQSGYDKDISNRTFDMWMDEESKGHTLTQLQVEFFWSIQLQVEFFSPPFIFNRGTNPDLKLE